MSLTILDGGIGQELVLRAAGNPTGLWSTKVLLEAPEMVKSNRPVIVLAGAIHGRGDLATVVALSTVPPTPVMDYHLLIPQRQLPRTKTFMNKETWLKGDMVYAVGFHRLDVVRLPGKDPNTNKRRKTD